jgi:hypothetical protein
LTSIKKSHGLAMFCAVALMTGCVGTKMVTVWSEPNFTGPPLRTVVVVALTANETNRKVVEDVFAEKLAKSGVQAIRSYVALKNADPSVDALKALVKQNGYDGVLAAWLVGQDEKTYYTPATVTVGYGFYGSPFWSTYPGFYGTVYSPGYMATETVVRVETGIWTTEGDGKRVWAGVSETTDPSSVAGISGEIANEVIAKAHRAGLI